MTYDEFVIAWSTYWGRRDIGFILENSMAAQIASSERSMRLYYAQWRAALEAFPGNSALWLMGTPDLTPVLLPTRSSDSVDTPPAARVGPYATANSGVSQFSERAGDYRVTFSPTSAAARFGRRVARGRTGSIVGIISLAVVWVPYMSIPLALVGLVWTSQAHWHLHQHFRTGHLPWRVRGPLIAGQLAAVASIVLAVILALPQLSSGTPAWPTIPI